MKAYRLAVLSALVLATFPAAALTACGSSSPSDSADGGGDDDDNGDDASIGSGGGDGSSTPDGPARVVPPPDGSMMSMTDAMLDAAPSDGPLSEPDASMLDCNEKIDGTQVFVSSKPGSGPSAPCNSQTPCNSIATALAYAVTKSLSVVYIDEGTYTEQVVLPPTIRRVRGGWKYANGEWTIDCTGARLMATTIIAPSSANMTVIAKDLGGSTSLESLNIVSKAAALPGESLYGVFATGASTKLTLLDTSVLMHAGGNGASGSDGVPGSAGAASCAAGSNPPASASPATAATMGGAGVTYNAAGAKVTSGGVGSPGGAGGNGVAGMNDCSNTCLDCETVTDPGLPPTCDSDGAMTVCATGGPPGCGGQAGGVGTGGQGGGSSIALYAYDAQVTVVNGVLQPGAGGSGGAGGAAGSAGPPSGGAEGMTARCVASCGSGGGRCMPTGPFLSGASGVSGAAGAAGVGGGGGAGGDSFGYYQNNNNVTIQTPGVGTAAAGAAGTGAPAGASGTAGTHNN